MVPTTFALTETNELKTSRTKPIRNNHQGKVSFFQQKLIAKGTYVPTLNHLPFLWGQRGKQRVLVVAHSEQQHGNSNPIRIRTIFPGDTSFHGWTLSQDLSHPQPFLVMTTQRDSKAHPNWAIVLKCSF